jgi:mannose-1-phosphate guanylyltransferase
MKSSQKGQCWAFVLAGGEGTRLRSLTTTTTGISIPKQFCSLRGGCSLLRDALDRAGCIASPQHICAIVAAQHLKWWSRCLTRNEVKHAVVQPANCGTASGVLLPLLKTLDKDPDCSVVVLPSDHYVENEAILARALQEAVAALGRHPDSVMMLGIEPDEPDPELGYIVAHTAETDGTEAVATFVEKPDELAAMHLIRRGAVWNAFIFAARGSVLLGLFERNAPELVSRMRAALHFEKLGPHGARAIDELYKSLSPLDFSRHICVGQEAHLRIVKVPRCGWTDLGTPKRVASALTRMRVNIAGRMTAGPSAPMLDLAVQYALSPDLRHSSVAMSAGTPCSRTT